MDMKQEKNFIIITIILIVLGVLYWYWTELIPRSKGPTVTPPGTAVQGDMTTKQLQELDALRAQLPSSSKTSAEQERELDTLRKQSGLSAPTQADIARQLKELEQLRMSK